jgi:hypothetical protein
MTASQLRLSVRTLLIFFSVVGLAVLAAGTRVWFLACQSTTWPRVTGQVVSIEQKSSVARRGSINAWAVVYEYVLHGQSHQGQRIAFGFHSKCVSQQLDQMRNGESIEISVDPRDASQSVLFPGATAATRIPTFVGLGILGFTALVAFLLRRDAPWKIT